VQCSLPVTLIDDYHFCHDGEEMWCSTSAGKPILMRITTEDIRLVLPDRYGHPRETDVYRGPPLLILFRLPHRWFEYR
jgi:hypothetical protein